MHFLTYRPQLKIPAVVTTGAKRVTRRYWTMLRQYQRTGLVTVVYLILFFGAFVWLYRSGWMKARVEEPQEAVIPGDGPRSDQDTRDTARTGNARVPETEEEIPPSTNGQQETKKIEDTTSDGAKTEAKKETKVKTSPPADAKPKNSKSPPVDDAKPKSTDAATEAPTTEPTSVSPSTPAVTKAPTTQEPTTTMGAPEAKDRAQSNNKDEVKAPQPTKNDSDKEQKEEKDKTQKALQIEEKQRKTESQQKLKDDGQKQPSKSDVKVADAEATSDTLSQDKKRDEDVKIVEKDHNLKFFGSPRKTNCDGKPRKEFTKFLICNLFRCQRNR